MLIEIGIWSNSGWPEPESMSAGMRPDASIGFWKWLKSGEEGLAAVRCSINSPASATANRGMQLRIFGFRDLKAAAVRAGVLRACMLWLVLLLACTIAAAEHPRGLSACVYFVGEMMCLLVRRSVEPKMNRFVVLAEWLTGKSPVSAKLLTDGGQGSCTE